MGEERFPSSCRTSPIPHAGITDPLFTCHTCTPKQSDLAERDRGKTKPPEQGEGEWWGRRIHMAMPCWRDSLDMSPVLQNGCEIAGTVLLCRSAHGFNFLTESSSSSLIVLQ